MLSVPFGVIKFSNCIASLLQTLQYQNKQHLYALSWPITGSGPFLKFIFLKVEQDSKVEMNDETCFVHYLYRQFLN